MKRTFFKPVAVLLFVAFIAMGLMLACVSDNPTAPSTDCSCLDYWTTDGR